MARSFRFPFRSAAKISSEVDEELAFHLATAAARLRAEGWSPADAEAEARRKFGDLEFTKSYCRAEDLRREQGRHRMTVADELVQDFRYALRSLRSAPGFTLIALATLALGIGANTAIFSVVRSVLLAPLPFASADRIVRFYDVNPTADVQDGTFSEPDFNDVRAASTTAASMGGYFFANGNVGVDLTGDGAPERLTVALVTPGFFETLKPQPVRGRVLLPEEHELGHNHSVVISYALWQRRFSGDPQTVGRTITLRGEPFTVVGIMQPEFTYPAAQILDVWMPLSNFGPDDIGRVRGAHFISPIARLKPGVTPEQFRTELSGIVAQLARSYPASKSWTSANVKSIRESIVGDVQRPLLVIVAAVGMVLLITCANLANLLLARGSTRMRELAVRAALGAGRGRIVRQLLTESLTLALAGGVLGAGLGYVAVRALVASGGAQLPRGADLHVDGVVLAFTLAVSVACGLVFGLVPALRSAGPALERSLRSSSRGTVGVPGQRMRSALILVEVALAVVLAVGASLTTKSFARLLAVDPGFKPSNALVVRLTIPDNDEPGRTAQYYRNLLETIRRVPGVVAVGSVRDLPTRGTGERDFAEMFGFPYQRGGEGTMVELHHISPSFFAAMGVPVLQGRDFAWTDDATRPLAMIINEAAAEHFWPGEHVAGKVIHAGKTDIQIIGVVGNVRQRGPGEAVEPTAYFSAMQNMRIGMSIVIRTAGDPLRLATPIRQAIASVNRNQTIAEVTTLADVLGAAVARPKLLAWLLAVFGFIGLLLGALGIYGLLAFAVAQRRQEIGVRTALGAPRAAVLRLVTSRGLALTLGGVIIGTVAARVLSQQLNGVLFGIAPNDTGTFVEVIAVLVATALVASWIPARRALAIDPVTALRYE
jgi:predicted permease